MNTTNGNGPPPADGYEIVVGMRRVGEPGYAPNACVGRDASTNVTWRVPTAWVTPMGSGVSGPGGGGGGGKHTAARTAATATPNPATSARRRGERERGLVGESTTPPSVTGSTGATVRRARATRCRRARGGAPPADRPTR